MQPNYADIPLDQCEHWFRESWFHCKSLNRPVRVKCISHNNVIRAIDMLGKTCSLEYMDLEIRVPDLGYIQYSLTTQKRKTLNTARYFYNLGSRCYKKGLDFSRIVQVYQHVDAQGYVVDPRYPIETRPNVGLLSSPQWLDSAFHPQYSHISDVHTTRYEPRSLCPITQEHIMPGLALSKDFAVSYCRTGANRDDEPFSLAYRGIYIAPMSDTYCIRLPPKLDFLIPKIKEEINDIQIARL